MSYFNYMATTNTATTTTERQLKLSKKHWFNNIFSQP